MNNADFCFHFRLSHTQETHIQQVKHWMWGKVLWWWWKPTFASLAHPQPQSHATCRLSRREQWRCGRGSIASADVGGRRAQLSSSRIRDTRRKLAVQYLNTISHDSIYCVPPVLESYPDFVFRQLSYFDDVITTMKQVNFTKSNTGLNIWIAQEQIGFKNKWLFKRKKERKMQAT